MLTVVVDIGETLSNVSSCTKRPVNQDGNDDTLHFLVGSCINWIMRLIAVVCALLVMSL